MIASCLRRPASEVNLNEPSWLCKYLPATVCNHEDVDNCILSHICDSIPTSVGPFFHVDLASVLNQYRRWNKLLPRVRPFYAVKCQPDPTILSLLAKLGCGFDCASKSEIRLVKDTSVDKTIGDSVVYANPFKFKKDMHYAKQCGIQMTTFDTIGELHRLAKEWPTAKLLLRILPLRSYDAQCSLGEKFGADQTEIAGLISAAKAVNMDIIGFSFHVGSGCSDPDAWSETVAYCAELFALARTAGYKPEILDIGGGFPGVNTFSKTDLTSQIEFELLTSRLNYALDKYFPISDGYRIIAEPGRYFVMGAYALATQIIGKHESEDINVVQCQGTISMDASKNSRINNKYVRYIINDGVYGSFNNVIFDHASITPSHIVTSTGQVMTYHDDTNRARSTIFGPTCDSFDCVLKEIFLPEIPVNFWLIWPNMGAYTTAARTQFNGIGPERDGIKLHINMTSWINCCQSNCSHSASQLSLSENGDSGLEEDIAESVII